MKLFSHRKGFKSIRTQLQVDSIDADLRNKLWNVLCRMFLDQRFSQNGYIEESVEQLGRALWHDYFKLPFDTMQDWDNVYNHIREYFFECQWFEVYDLIEFVANNYRDERTAGEFILVCNHTLETEVSGYRFVNGKIAEITNETEIAEIE